MRHKHSNKGSKRCGKQTQKRKEGLKDINVRIDRNKKLLKEEKDPEHRKKLKKRISRLESQKKMCNAKKRYSSEEEAIEASLNVHCTDPTRPPTAARTAEGGT